MPLSFNYLLMYVVCMKFRCNEIVAGEVCKYRLKTTSFVPASDFTRRELQIIFTASDWPNKITRGEFHAAGPEDLRSSRVVGLWTLLAFVYCDLRQVRSNKKWNNSTPIKSSILYTSYIIIDHRGHRPPQFVSIPTDRDIKSNNILDTEEVSSFDRRSKVFPTPRRYPVSSVWKECRCKLSCFKMVDRRDYFVLDKFNTHIFISTNQKCPTVPNHSDPSNRSVAHHPSVVMVAMVVAVVDSLMM